MEPGRSRWDHMREAARYAADLREGKVGPDDLALALQAASPTSTRYLLVVDQFEEFFTLCHDDAARNAYVRLLTGLPREHWLNVLLTVRADFFGRILGTPGLAERADAGQFNLLPMKPEELRAAVEKPAAAAGRAFEKGLADRILAAVAHEPGQLPLLQFALGLLWDGQTADGVLTHDAYAATREVEGAIACHAEAVFGKLSAADQLLAQRLFARLVRVAQPDEGLEDTRRRVALDELSEAEAALARTLAGQDHRLVVADRDPATSKETVEVVHEAIISSWARLRGWLDEDREFLLWRQRLASYLAGWERTDRQDAGALLAGGLLAETERWLASREGWSPAERAYVETSVAHRQAQETQRQEEEERLRAALAAAERNSRVARARELATFAMTELARSEDASGSRALLLARQAVLATQEMGEPVEAVAQEALQRAVGVASIFRLSLKGHAKAVNSAMFSPDNRRIVTASDDRTARVWDAISGVELCQILGHTGRVTSATFSPDGRWIVTAGADTQCECGMPSAVPSSDNFGGILGRSHL